MSLNSLIKSFWVYYNTGNPAKALGQIPKIEKHYERWAIDYGHDIEETKKVFMEELAWAIKQAKKMVISPIAELQKDDTNSTKCEDVV